MGRNRRNKTKKKRYQPLSFYELCELAGFNYKDRARIIRYMEKIKKEKDRRR